MTETIFLIVLSLLLFVMFRWAFRTLPTEKWQIMATVPTHKENNGLWSGLNLTWYGFFIANACVIALAIYLILTSSVDVPITASITLALFILVITTPMTRIIAHLVEGKHFTSTIGGASFVGIVLAPMIVLITNQLTDRPFPFFPVMAAVMIAYALGEGAGRIACISFGCCYGKPLANFSPSVQRLFSRWAFTFLGKSKKIAYESGFDGQKVMPVQAFSAVIASTAGLVGLVFFFTSQFSIAYFLPAVTTQLWRFFSEFLRADFRGFSKITIYQKMSLAAVLYITILTFLIPPSPPLNVNLGIGLLNLWNPIIILALQTLWVIFFLYTGRSKVTGAQINFFIHRDRI
ncbi:MAG: prolipoprotein diacylglyceryl transferase [Syntrophales bacterium]|nr:prolipoprotein diacylglyceryl transferase [Syntrophales bacterium]